MKNLFILFGLLVFSFSCNNTPNQKAEQPKGLMISSYNSGGTSCPFLTTDHKGNILVSWVKETKDSSNILYYAVSHDKGNSFSQATAIFPSKGLFPHAENLPKIAFKPDGGMIAIWGVNNPTSKNKYSGLVYYSQSFDYGKTWSKAHPLVENTVSDDQRYFDVAILQNGEAGISWLDGRNKGDQKGATLFYAETKGELGFQNEKPIGETCCECCRTDLFIDSRGDLHAVYRDIINDSIRDMVHIVSIDSGKTFSPPRRISADNWIIDGCPHTGPTMTETVEGLHFAWYTAGGKAGVYYCNSNDGGQKFSYRKLLSSEGRHPQMTAMPDGSVCVVWEELVKEDSAFYSKIVLELISPDGRQIQRDLTANTGNAGFPVISATGEKSVAIAWVQQTENKMTENAQHNHSTGGQVYFTMVDFE